MIVRQSDSGFVLIKQHEHGLISGEFARRFSSEWSGSPTEETYFAVSNHDLGWKMLDADALWNDESGEPFSFLDYPSAPKMEAYTRGLDAVESESRYAALLCSAHYGTFVESSDDPDEAAFGEREKDRRECLRASLAQSVLDDFERDLSLLRACDDLSLFVCLNETGENEHPWYRGGLTLFGETVAPVWRSESALTFEPYPFAGEFEVEIPYRVFGRDRRESESGSYKVRIAP